MSPRTAAAMAHGVAALIDAAHRDELTAESPDVRLYAGIVRQNLLCLKRHLDVVAAQEELEQHVAGTVH